MEKIKKIRPQDMAMEQIQWYIQENQLKPHTQLPSERELCTMWQMNRSTLHTAIQQLIEERKLYSVKGSGTFVAPPRLVRCEGLEAHNFAEESLYKVLRDLGILLTKGTEKVEITFATEEEAKLLKVEEGQYLYYQSGVVNDDRGVGIEFFRIMARPDQVQYTNVLTRRDTR